MIKSGYMPVFPAILAYVFCDKEMRGRNMILVAAVIRYFMCNYLSSVALPILPHE